MSTAEDKNESWAAIVNADDDSESYNTLSASIESVALTSPKPKVELYNSGASRHMSPFSHRFINLRSIAPRPITATNN